MATREEIREGMREILSEDLIITNITHENAPPGKDCSEECGISIEDQIAATNPILSPMRSGGKKHKKCMGCWDEYIEGLITRLTIKQDSQGVVIKIKCPDCAWSQFSEETVGMTPCYRCESTGYITEPLIEEENNG